MTAQPPVALTVAGSDSGGAAGIQADLKTFAAHGVFGTCAVTALTAQNTAGVRAIRPVPVDFVAAQLDAVLDDLPVRAAKTGMLATVENVTLLADRAGRLPNLVVDPVLVSSTGAVLFDDAVRRAYLDLLFPLATVVTPNGREAAVLTGREVSTVDDAVAAARRLGAAGPRWVVVKGGNLDGGPDAVDVIWHDDRVELLRAAWIETANNHGTGCTFAAATAAGLARGDDVRTALVAAKGYVHRALSGSAGWRLGTGHGPLAWQAAVPGTSGKL